MIYKSSKQQLIKQGLIKKCPIDYKAVNNLLRRAKIDLKTAKRNITEDKECAYNYAYNAMLHSGLALMFSEGARPEIKNKHLIIIQFASSVLPGKLLKLINKYDYMRKKRNKFIYEPDIPCSCFEAKDAIATAEEFIRKIAELIRKNNPQKEFEF